MINFIKNIDWSNISAGTTARTIVLVLAFINQILSLLGWNPISFVEDDVYTSISTVITIGASVVSWWKNNSVTTEAIKADELLSELKTE